MNLPTIKSFRLSNDEKICQYILEYDISGVVVSRRIINNTLFIYNENIYVSVDDRCSSTVVYFNRGLLPSKYIISESNKLFIINHNDIRFEIGFADIDIEIDQKPLPQNITIRDLINNFNSFRD